MRILLITVLTALLAWGVWSVLGSPEDAPTPLDEPVPEPAEPVLDEHASSRARLSTGTLVVTVRTPGSTDAPPGARAGYLYAGEPRLKEVSKTGEARFTDAPLGTLTVIARAPGYPEVRQRRAVIAGLREDVIIVLEPQKR